MRESLYSPLWHHVAELRPRLRAGVRVQRQRYRGETWYLLVDEESGKQHRINAPAYQFIGRFDARASVNDLWSRLLEQFGDEAPGQDEALRLLRRLAEAELLQLDGADIDGLFQRSAERRRRRRPWVNPLAFPLPLFDPSRLLARLDPLAQALFRPRALAAWLALVAAAALAGAMHWEGLRAHGLAHMTSGHYLVLAWVAYPFVKLAHELGHALAVRRGRGEVHEFGITLLFFLPAPYVDASAAAAFRERGARFAVSAAGIAVELAIGAAALLAFLALEPGVPRDVAFVLVFVCVSSSLLFNGNPLLRFDGYHALCDLLDTPNLALRSHAWWLHLMRKALAPEAAAAPACARGEKKWLIVYAPLSWAYRLALSAALVLWVAQYSGLLGWVAAALLGVFVLARPVFGTLRALWRSLPAGATRRRAAALFASAGMLAAFVLFAAPVPNTLTVQGVVWPSEQARVRAETEGFVAEVLARDGEEVVPGSALVVLSEPGLAAERDRLRARLLGLSARQYEAILREPAQARNVIEELERTRTELDELERRIAQWTVRAKAAGRLVLPKADDLPGSFVAKGATLAYVLEPTPAIVRAAVPQEHAPLVRGREVRVEVRLAEAPAVLPALLLREVPAATRSLPSAALGERAGGSHLIDPADKEGTQALEPVFLFDVELEARPVERLGQRAWVRFDLGLEPLALQWQRRARQLFLKHFNPVT